MQKFTSGAPDGFELSLFNHPLEAVGFLFSLKTYRVEQLGFFGQRCYQTHVWIFVTVIGWVAAR